MPRMTLAEYNAYEARMAASRRGVPVLDELIKDDDAVAAGREVELLHRPIIAELNRRGWVYHYNDPTKPTHSTPGTPDFVIWRDGGQVLNIECKTMDGVLSAAQESFRERIMALGHEYQVVRSMRRFLQIAGL